MSADMNQKALLRHCELQICILKRVSNKLEHNELIIPYYSEQI